MMKLIIHRGTQEIGGTCVEVFTPKTRILLDLGLPLVTPKDKTKKLDSLGLSRKSAAELREDGILPAVTGLWADSDDGPSVDAVLLSHPHQDHYGLLRHIRPDIPVYLSDDARRILAASDRFVPTKAHIRNPMSLSHRKPTKIDDIVVKPYMMDHSGFGAMGFLMVGEGKRLFYTGDFRAHGRKGRLFDQLIEGPPKRIGRLLMEGTTLGRPGRKALTESGVEDLIVKHARKWKGLKLAYASAQNIDRMVSFYRAAIRTRGIFAVDLYTAFILDSLEHKSIPHFTPGFERLRVFYTKPLMRQMARNGMSDLFRRFRPYEITPAQIAADPGKVFLMFRNKFQDDVLKIGRFEDSVLIYSQWEGYRNEPSFARIEEFLTENGIGLESAHASGHACREDLARFVKALAPKVLTPIHTFNPMDYYELWHTVEPFEDGKAYDV